MLKKKMCFFLSIMALSVLTIGCKKINEGSDIKKKVTVTNTGLYANLNGEIHNSLTKADIDTDKDDLSLAFLKYENKGQNMIYSPLSIKYSLYMLNECATGETKEEIEKVINGAAINGYNNIKDTLALNNGIFINVDFKENVKEETVKKLNSTYGAEVFIDPFENFDNINSWIKKNSFGMIDDMVKEDILNPDSVVMALVNTLAIDMDWFKCFEQSENSTFTFHGINNDYENINMAYGNFTSNDIKYINDENIVAVKLPLREYEDVQLEYIAIMPQNKNLNDFIEDNTYSDIEKIIVSGKESSANGGIHITMPVFEYDYDLNLDEDLKSLGIKKAFCAEADFSAITDLKVYLKTLHKTRIALNGEGIKAASATFSAETVGCNNMEREELIFDKPFLYIIRDAKTKETWFVGTFFKPSIQS